MVLEDIKGKPAKGGWGGKPSPDEDRVHVKDTNEFLGPDRNLVQRMASPMVRLSRWFSNRRLRKSSEYWQGFEDTIKAAQQQQHPRAGAYAAAEQQARSNVRSDRVRSLLQTWKAEDMKRKAQQPPQAAKQPQPKATAS